MKIPVAAIALAAYDVMKPFNLSKQEVVAASLSIYENKLILLTVQNPEH